MKKNKAIIIILVLIIFLFTGVFVFLTRSALQRPSGEEEISAVTRTLQESTEFSLDSGIEKKNIEEVNTLSEIPDRDKAVVVQIKDIEKLQNADPLFNRAYQGDYVIFTPTQTIIYDGSTSTIRDISSKSLYQYVSQ